jgi:hypothetical protein
MPSPRRRAKGTPAIFSLVRAAAKEQVQNNKLKEADDDGDESKSSGSDSFQQELLTFIENNPDQVLSFANRTPCCYWLYTGRFCSDKRGG